MNGKGDKQRPTAVTGKEYRDNHERIWGNKTVELEYGSFIKGVELSELIQDKGDL